MSPRANLVRKPAVVATGSVEVSRAATHGVEGCRAQSQIRGRAVLLGFPFPVPATSRLAPLVH